MNTYNNNNNIIGGANGSLLGNAPQTPVAATTVPGTTAVKPKSFKVKVSNIAKFAKFVEGANNLTGKPFKGYWVKVHINDTVSGDIWIANNLVWLNSDNKKNPVNDGEATVVLPEHFTYNVKTFDKSTGDISQLTFIASDVKTLLTQKEQFILNLK